MKAILSSVLVCVALTSCFNYRNTSNIGEPIAQRVELNLSTSHVSQGLVEFALEIKNNSKTELNLDNTIGDCRMIFTVSSRFETAHLTGRRFLHASVHGGYLGKAFDKALTVPPNSSITLCIQITEENHTSENSTDPWAEVKPRGDAMFDHAIQFITDDYTAYYALESCMKDGDGIINIALPVSWNESDSEIYAIVFHTHAPKLNKTFEGFLSNGDVYDSETKEFESTSIQLLATKP